MSDSSEIILAQFPNLSEVQKEQFAELKSIYSFWNQQINVVSRKDFDQFYTRHVLHGLAIAKVISFLPKTKILDIGTGGGFPGVPLAILFPESPFHLVDSIGKKIKVVNEVSQHLQLENVSSEHARAEQLEGKYDFIISRAVTAMPTFLTWTNKKLSNKSKHDLKNGILYLKGGDLTEEMKPIKKKIDYYNISDFFDDPFFETKKVVYLKG